jgi:hypothetical protein
MASQPHITAYRDRPRHRHVGVPRRILPTHAPVIDDALQVRVALGGRRGAHSFRKKRASNIMPFSGQVLGSHETPFRPISPEWVRRRLAD